MKLLSRVFFIEISFYFKWSINNSHLYINTFDFNLNWFYLINIFLNTTFYHDVYCTGYGLENLTITISCRLRHQQLIKFCFGTVLIFWLFRTVQRNQDWSHEEQLYRSGIAINPAKGSIFFTINFKLRLDIIAHDQGLDLHVKTYFLFGNIKWLRLKDLHVSEHADSKSDSIFCFILAIKTYKPF